jgi:hypothetical protein
VPHPFNPWVPGSSPGRPTPSELRECLEWPMILGCMTRDVRVMTVRSHHSCGRLRLSDGRMPVHECAPGREKGLAELWGAQDKIHARDAVKAFEALYGPKIPPRSSRRSPTMSRSRSRRTTTPPSIEYT